MGDMYRYRQRHEQAGTRFLFFASLCQLRVFLCVLRSRHLSQTSAWQMLHQDKTAQHQWCDSVLLRHESSTLTVSEHTKTQETVMSSETAQAPESSILPLDGTTIFARSAALHVLMTIPQMTAATSQQRETNGEIGSVSSAKRLTTANSTHISNMLSEQSSEIIFLFLASA